MDAEAILSAESQQPEAVNQDQGTEGSDAGKLDGMFSQRFATLTKKERELLQKEREIQERQNKIKEQFGSYDDFLALKDKNPLEAIERMGLSYEELTKRALESDDDPVKKLEKKFTDWEAKMEEDKKRREMEDNDRKISSFKAQIKAQIEADSDTFDIINTTGNYDLVYDVISKHFEKTQAETGQGQILSIAEAAKKVETYLEKEFEDKIMRSKKFSSKFKTQKSDSLAQEFESALSERKTDTLTNDFAQNQSGSSSQSVLSREESLARAAQLLRFKD